MRTNFSRLFMVAAILFELAARAEAPPNEYAVKTFFVMNFAKFVNWPINSAKHPFNICTGGLDAVQSQVEGAVTAAHGDFRVQPLNSPEAAHNCQILFLGANQRKRIRAYVMSVASEPVLTVGENDGFLEAGGIVCFAVDGGRVRFDINLEAANKAQLKIDSRLLSLARNIRH